MLDFNNWLLQLEQPLNKTVHDLRRVFLKCQRLPLVKSERVSSKDMEAVLPFGKVHNRLICSCLSDQKNFLSWKTCLSACALLVSGGFRDKFTVIYEIYNLKSPSRNGLQLILESILYAVKRISFCVEDMYGNGHDCFVADYYDLDSDETTLLVDTITSALKNPPAELTVLKPTKFEWRPVSYPDPSSAPCSRAKQATCRHDSKVYLYGGRDRHHPLDDFWVYDLVTECWREIKPRGDSPKCLEDHTLVSYPQTNSLYLFGGVIRLSDEEQTPLWIYDIDDGEWRHWKCESEVILPPCLKGHSSVLYDGRIYVFGGAVELAGPMDAIWCFVIESNHWQLEYSGGGSQASNSSGPCSRQYHTATVYNHEMYIIGGMSQLEMCSDMWKWSFVDREWTKLKCSTSIPQLYAHTANLVGSSIFVIGGEGNNNKTMWEYKIPSSSWSCRTSSLDNGPKYKSYHSTLVIPHSAYSVSSNRTQSVPFSHSLPDFNLPERPFSCPTREETRSPGSKLSRNRVYPLIDLSPTPTVVPSTKEREYPESSYFPTERWVNSTNNQFTYKNKSDECLLRPLSIENLEDTVFENPGYRSSLESMIKGIPRPVSQSKADNRNWLNLSRSLDSIRDMHETTINILPGSILDIGSQETLNTVCTVRNVVLDEQTTPQSDYCDSLQQLPKIKQPVLEDQMFILVLGGKVKGISSSYILPISTWKCKLHMKTK